MIIYFSHFHSQAMSLKQSVSKLALPQILQAALLLSTANQFPILQRVVRLLTLMKLVSVLLMQVLVVILVLSFMCTRQLDVSSRAYYVNLQCLVLSRYCVPYDDATLSKLEVTASYMLNFDGSDSLQQWVSDIKTTWPVIAVSVAVAFVIG
jgi:hypothetical protein